MKTRINMKKLLIIFLAVCCSTQIFAQADPLIQNTLMSPNPLAVGQIGQLRTDVRNNGSVDITAGCAIVTISVPSTICGATLTLNPVGSSPIWTVLSSGTGVIVLKNTAGVLPFGASSFPIVLNVSGDAKGGPLTILAVISLGLGCTGLGDLDPNNNDGTTSLSVYGIYTWVGATNANGDRWNIASNWLPATVPLATDKAIIPVVAPNKLPKLVVGPAAINDIQIDANATVDIYTNTFTINGAVTGTGTLKGSSTSSLIIGGNAGTLNFTAGNRALWNFTLNANATASLGTALDIAVNPGLGGGSLTVDAGAILTTNGNLTIKSDDNGTSSVGISAGTITGNATVERNISDAGHRAWHLLGTNTTGSQTIYNAWQEGGANVANKGTWLTSGNSLLSGFDGTSINGASILIHDQTVPSWTTIPVSNTDATALSSRPGYFLFVRGDRNYTPTVPSPTATNQTVLRSTGGLKQGTQPAAVVYASGSGRTLVGNPFASAIDMETIFTGTTNLDQNMLIWDPTLTGSSGVGGYRAIVRTAGPIYTQTPVVLGGAVVDVDSRYIHSGQAFFLKATGSNASVVFTEAVKTANTPTIYNPIVAAKGDQTLIANLMIPEAGGTNSLLDGIRISYNDAYTAALTDDIEKMSNFGENISSFRKGTKLIVERRPMIMASDTIFLQMTKTTVKDYRFQIGTIDFVQEGVTAFLEDTYLKTKTKLDLTGSVNYADFSITADAASANPDRFMIVFKGAPVLAPSTITLNAAKQDSYIAVDWKAANQYNIKQYELEKSTDAVLFTKVNTQAATGINGSTVIYNWLDANPVTGDNFYRLSYVSPSGEQKYTATVKVNMPFVQPLITIYPNPVSNKVMTVKFEGMKKGNYDLKLLNAKGQTIFIKQVVHLGGTATFIVNMSNVVSGKYFLEILGSDKSSWKMVKTLEVLN